MVTQVPAGVTFDDDAPIVLAGDPRRLRGTMVLRNPGDDAVVLRRARLTDVSAEAGARSRSALPLGARLPPVRLAPGSVTSVPLRVRVDAATPPGEYREEIDIAGMRREVVLQVSERVDLRIRPRLLVIPNVAGATSRKTVAFENHGNVPVTVPEFLVAVLDDERFDCRVLRRALAEVDADTATFEGYLDQLIRSGKATIEEIGHVGIRLDPGPVDVPPGATVPATMELHVPDRVDRHSRYQAVVPIATTDLTVIVAPFGVPGPGERPGSGPSQPEAEASSGRAAAKKSVARSPRGRAATAKKSATRKSAAKSSPAKKSAGSRNDEEPS